MDRQILNIAEPCTEKWDEMSGDARRRFCGVCSKHVHNLSALTRDEANALIDGVRSGGPTPCVTYVYGPDDRIVFAGEPIPKPMQVFREVPRGQRHGIRRLLATAAFIPLLAALPACDTSSPPEPPAIVVGEDGDYGGQVGGDRPFDHIVETERRFEEKLRELFGEAPEYQMLAGAPMIAPDSVREGSQDPEFDQPNDPIYTQGFETTGGPTTAFDGDGDGDDTTADIEEAVTPPTRRMMGSMRVIEDELFLEDQPSVLLD